MQDAQRDKKRGAGARHIMNATLARESPPTLVREFSLARTENFVL